MTNKGSLLKKGLTHLAAIILFLIISLLYFQPQFEGKVLPKGDVTQYVGMSQELREYYNEEGESSEWTNSMFSGMPAYQIGVWGGSPNFIDYVEKPLRALGENAGPVFAGMLMAYILFIVMGVNPFISMAGAIAYSLGSYNIIIIQAGHMTKAWAIAYLPLIIAGMMALFRQKYMQAGVLMALGLALQIKSNHLQITYYTAILCVFLFVAFIIEMVRKKEMKNLLKASGIMTLAVAIALLCNLGSIYANYEMGQESTRGQSELSKPSDVAKKSSGLDKDYAFSWSYGKAETLTLLLPNFHGGASGTQLDKSSRLYKELKAHGADQMLNAKGTRANTYWGDQPFTSGPVYLGAIVFFLFVLGLIIVRSNVKWALLIATIFFIFLSWGRNMDWFNDIMFHYLPMYNKFRTVSMALVIPSLTMLLLAIWGLKEFFSGEIAKETLMKALYISVGITGGLALFFWVAPGFFFNFISPNDVSFASEVPEWYYEALLADRRDLFSSDAGRSLIFILLAGSLLLANLKFKKISPTMNTTLIAGLAILILVDLWSVDKRYLSEDHFVTEKNYKNSSFPESTADKFILEDKSPSYRVLTLGGGTFNESATSYRHKSIGGYHAAKLKRYQELIDNHLAMEVSFLDQRAMPILQEEIEKARNSEDENVGLLEIAKSVQDNMTKHLAMVRVIAMLNTRYIIYHPEMPPLQNPFTMGNAWFVDGYELVDNADIEIERLGEINPLDVAIVDKRYSEELSGLDINKNEADEITLLECKPNYLKYESEAVNERLAIFSEIYYAKGWQAYVDGKPADHICADWTLRAMRVPAGRHEIEFKFEPTQYRTARKVATASSAVLVLILLASIGLSFRNKKEEE